MAKTAINIYLKKAIESGFEFIERRFGNLDELNKNFQAQRSCIFENLRNKADYKRRLAKVLEVLKLHSCKYVGISYMAENSLCGAYEAQFGESISKRTVSTCMKHLRELGLVSVFPTKREDGKQSANIVVMEKLDLLETGKAGSQGSSDAESGKLQQHSSPQGGGHQDVAHKESGNLHTEKTTSSCKTTDKDLEERKARERRLLNFVPSWFKGRIACVATDPKEVNEYWKVARYLMRNVYGERIAQEERAHVVEDAILEFYQSAKAASKGKFLMRKPFGFFHAVLEGEASAHVRRRVRAMQPGAFDWLEA